MSAALQAHLLQVGMDWIQFKGDDCGLSGEQALTARRRVRELLDDDPGNWPLALKAGKDALNSAMRQVASDLIPTEDAS